MDQGVASRIAAVGDREHETIQFVGVVGAERLA
jgi:hypothetical protein